MKEVSARRIRSARSSPIRTPRGRDIFAACGQLRSESVKKSAAEKRREALANEVQA